MNTRTDNAKMILLAPFYALAFLAAMLWMVVTVPLLFAVDPLVNRAHLVLSETELLRATNRKEVPSVGR